MRAHTLALSLAGAFVLSACIYGFVSRCEERNNNALMQPFHME